MLLQDIFVIARPHRVHKNFLPESAVHYSYYLKSNDIIIGQRKTIDLPLKPMIDFVYLT